MGQYYATEEGIVNVNPYELPAIVGRINLHPFEDIWTTTTQDPVTLDETTTNPNIWLQEKQFLGHVISPVLFLLSLPIRKTEIC